MPEMTPERLREIEARCEAFQPKRWDLRTDDDGRYFKYAEDGSEIYSTAYHVDGLNTLGDHECGAMELPAAEFVFHAKEDIPDLLTALKETALEVDRVSSSLAVRDDMLQESQAALKQVTEERDGYAASLAEVRSYCERWKHNYDIFNVVLELSADPAERLKARDAEIRRQALLDAVNIARETAGARTRIIHALSAAVQQAAPEKLSTQLFPLGEFIAEELEARGWTTQDFACRIENVLAREHDGKLMRDIQVRQLEIELVIAGSDDRNCYSSEDSLKAFARGLGCDWKFLANIQDAYRSGGKR